MGVEVGMGVWGVLLYTISYFLKKLRINVYYCINNCLLSLFLCCHNGQFMGGSFHAFTLEL